MDGAHAEQVRTILRWLKDGPPGGLPVAPDDGPLAALEAVTWRDAHDEAALERLTRWRRAACLDAPAPFPLTPAGARAWLVEQVLDIPDRLLFWVKGPDDEPLGHVGLCRFDFARRSAELDHLLRGEPGVMPGVMSASVVALGAWAFDALRLGALVLRAAPGNTKALRLARRCGFRETVRNRQAVTLRLGPAGAARQAA
jgi:RimJ/RimL family protein N-acetyltransferase